MNPASTDLPATRGEAVASESRGQPPHDAWLMPASTVRDAFARAFTPGRFVAQGLMLRIALIFVAFSFISFSLSTVMASVGGMVYPVQIAIGLLITGLMSVIAARLASQERLTASYAALLIATLTVQFTGSVLADYGIYAAVLTCGIVPLSLGYLLFSRRYVLLWGGPIFLFWIFVFAAHLSGLIGQHPLTPRPMPGNVLFSLMSVLVSVISVIHLLAAQAEAAWQKLQGELASQSQSLENETQLRSVLQRFVGHLSHEIRNPVAALRNAVTLLSHPNATPAVRERSIRLVDLTSRNLLDLLNDTLDILKFRDPQFTLRTSVFSLHTLLEELRELYEGVAEEKSLTLRIEVLGDSSELWVGDVMRLRQMLSNLLGNAFKFTDSGHVHVRVSCTNPISCLWRFEVIDTGCGIASENQVRLFTPFTQVHDNGRKPIAGTGLGLSIVQDLARAMGGAVGLNSQVGHGATFWFEVPLRKPDMGASM